MKQCLPYVLGSMALILSLSLSAPVLAQGSPWTQVTHTEADVNELRNRTVFFVHNSVGQNIVNGLQSVAPGIAVTNGAASGGQPASSGFTEVYMNHVGMGDFNRRPIDKINAFETLINNGGHKARIAFFKFCFQDFDGDMPEPDVLFTAYRNTLNTLQARHPNVTFVHMTAPLYTHQASYHNRKQHDFNNRLRAEYGGRVFDLAAIEAINANGTPAATALNPSAGAPTLSLDWAVGASDSHLNSNGGQRVASGLVSFLARVSLTPDQPGQPGQFGPTRHYSGQWIRDGEDAWGLTILQNFSRDSRYLFSPWFTYDSSGNAAWYIFQGDHWSANDTISMEVYRYTGSNWGTMPYDNNRVTNTRVGTAKLTFTSATTARFEYSVDNSSRTIDLVRLDGATSTVGQYTGQWVRDGEDAWGLTVLRGFSSNPDYVFVPWYTYDRTGKASWYLFQSDSLSAGNTVSADVYRYTGPNWGVMPYNNGSITSAVVGTVRLTFLSETRAQFEYDVDGSKRIIDLRKLD